MWWHLAHQSESLVLWVAQTSGIEEDLGEKGQRGVLKSQKSRATFLSDEGHRIRFVYTPKHTSWLQSDRDLVQHPGAEVASPFQLYLDRGPQGADPGVHRLLQPDDGQTHPLALLGCAEASERNRLGISAANLLGLVGESRRHDRRPFSDSPLFVTFIKRSNRPTEIIAIHRKIGHRLVHPPSLRERGRLADLPRVVVPVRRVLPLQERGVDPPADFRPRQRRHHRGGQLVRLRWGTIGSAPARLIDPPGSNGTVGAVPGGDSRGLLGPAPGHRNSIPARTIPGPGHGVPLPKVDRQGGDETTRPPCAFYDRRTTPSSAAVPPPPTASRPPPTPSPCAPTSGPSPDANN